MVYVGLRLPCWNYFAIAFSVAMTSFASECEIPAVEPGAVIWRGVPDGIDRRHSRPIVELSPDGKSVLFLQGLPWPRLMLQPIEPADADAIMLGTQAPFGTRQPRFSPDGAHVYFTAELDWRPRRRPRKGESSPGDDLRTAVVRIALRDSSETILAPVPGSARDAFGIFLDLESSGDRALIGTGRGLRAYGSLMSPYEMQAFEIDLRGKAPRKELPFVVKEDALVRYSRDGRLIYYTIFARHEGLAVVYGYDRETGRESKLHRDVLRIGWRAGDVDIAALGVAHLGSFGFDGFLGFLLRHGHDDPAVQWRTTRTFLDRDDAQPVWPRTVRGTRALVRTGPPDLSRFAVTEWDAAAYQNELSMATKRRSCLGDARLPEPRERLAKARAESLRLARVRPEVKETVESLGRSLILLGGAPVDAVRVRWKEARAEVGVVREFEVIETARGALRIEKVTPALDELDAPMKEIFVSDGRSFRFTDDRGDTRDIPEQIFVQERVGVSPYHLLLDPAGLTHPDLEFVSIDGAGPEKRLGFEYLDGYSGELKVEVDGALVRPTEIISRMAFASDQVRVSMGNPRGKTDWVTKSVRFEDFRPVAGRLVPHRVIFENGLRDYTLTLDSMELNPELSNDTFDCE